jgi:hypothetical protein
VLNGRQGYVAEPVFNLGEIGISDWEYRKTTKAIGAAAMPGQTILHGVSRNVKHTSVIACASAAGASLFPYLVTSKSSSTVSRAP